MALEIERGLDRHRRGEAALEAARPVARAERARGRVQQGHQPAAVDDAGPALQRRGREEAAAAVGLEARGGGHDLRDGLGRPARARPRAILASVHVAGHSTVAVDMAATRVTGPAAEFLRHGPFARIMLTNFFFFGALNGFLLLPLYIQQLGGDEADIGLVQGFYSAAGIVCQPVVGALIDYLGRRFFMRLGVGLLVVSCALFVVSSPLPLLGALRVLQGVAFSAFFVANYIHVVEMVPAERRGWALGIFGLSGLVSTSLAPLFGELMIRRFGFPWFFAAATVIARRRARGVLERAGRPARRARRAPGLHVIREGLLELRHMHMCSGSSSGSAPAPSSPSCPPSGRPSGSRASASSTPPTRWPRCWCG